MNFHVFLSYLFSHRKNWTDIEYPKENHQSPTRPCDYASPNTSYHILIASRGSHLERFLTPNTLDQRYMPALSPGHISRRDSLRSRTIDDKSFYLGGGYEKNRAPRLVNHEGAPGRRQYRLLAYQGLPFVMGNSPRLRYPSGFEFNDPSYVPASRYWSNSSTISISDLLHFLTTWPPSYPASLFSTACS
jgi:hypothetical protein